VADESEQRARERQAHTASAFVEIVDTLVDDFDVIDFLHVLVERCVQLLGVAAAGLLLADGRGALQMAAASTSESQLLELFQLQAGEGPCLDCYRTGMPISVDDLATHGKWPRFTAAAVEFGFAGVHALPMRLRTDIIGTLNLFTTEPGELAVDGLRIGQALADIATIGLLQQRAIHRRDVLTEQLQAALNSRVLIEQAKGLLAERLHVTVDDAFTVLRGSARNRNLRLSDVAQAVLDGTDEVPRRPGGRRAAAGQRAYDGGVAPDPGGSTR
jgi:transcriptional regulator with GAF, ATPase, and Fis domain